MEARPPMNMNSCMPKYTMALVTNKQTKLAGIKPSQAKRIS